MRDTRPSPRLSVALSHTNRREPLALARARARLLSLVSAELGLPQVVLLVRASLRQVFSPPVTHLPPHRLSGTSGEIRHVTVKRRVNKIFLEFFERVRTCSVLHFHYQFSRPLSMRDTERRAQIKRKKKRNKKFPHSRIALGSS